jgi:hypothetical protein
MTMTNTRSRSTSEVSRAGLTGTARTTLLYLGLAITGAIGFQLARGQLYVADTPGAAPCPTWSNTHQWRARASSSRSASC